MPAEPERIVLHGGTLVDVESGNEISNSVVLIEGDRIKAVGREGEIPIPPNTVRMDARGKWIIPASRTCMPILASMITSWSTFTYKFGVTTVRDVGGDITPLRILRDEVESGKTPGPRISYAGMILDGNPRFGPEPAPCWPIPPTGGEHRPLSIRPGRFCHQGL